MGVNSVLSVATVAFEAGREKEELLLPKMLLDGLEKAACDCEPT